MAAQSRRRKGEDWSLPETKLVVTEDDTRRIPTSIAIAKGHLGDGDMDNLLLDKLLNVFPYSSERTAQNKVLQLNSIYKNLIDTGEDIDSCELPKEAGTGGDSITAFPYQDFLRRYINTRIPNRGLLVYHGLGSGKTATSIGILESCLDHRRVVVILPASLRDNYRKDIRKVGPSLFGNGHLGGYKYWRFQPATEEVDIQRHHEETLVPVDTIRSLGGVFLPVPTSDEGTLRLEMTRDERLRLDKQILEMIASRVTFIASNGLTAESAKKLDFDSSVIVCDEVHKLISMRRNRSPVGISLYNAIRNAKGAKVILLSGTPIINAPFEIAIIANLIHGKPTLHAFALTIDERRRGGKASTDEAILKDVLLDPVVHYARIQPSPKRGAGNELVVIRHEDDFRSVYDSNGEYLGALYDPDWEDGKGAWKQKFADRLQAKGINITTTGSGVRVFTEDWLPEDEMTFLREYTNSQETGDDVIRREEYLSRRLAGMVSFYRGASKKLLPFAEEIRVVKIPMSDEQFSQYVKARKMEIDLEDQIRLKSGKTEKPGGEGRGRSEDDGDDTFTGRFMTRQMCNMVFPESVERPTKQDIRRRLQQQGSGSQRVPTKQIDEEYAKASREAMEALREHPGFKDNLATYSPKMMMLLENLARNNGLALIYSNFLHMEGLEGVTVVLENAGYAPLEIERGDDGAPRLSQRTLASLPGAPRFAIYSGEVDEETRSWLVQIYRGELARLPPKLREDLVRLLGGEDKARNDGTDNLHGELLKILMITGAGAEGLDLKAIRQVHILEPYWNRAREEQVFGRAVRICSHAELPPEERNVERFIYQMVFGDGQVSESETEILRARDDGKTTDEYMYELAERKQVVVNAFLRLLQRVAVDCALHASRNDMLPSECYVTPEGELRELVAPSFTDDLDDLRVVKRKYLTGLVDIETAVVYITPDGKEEPRGTYQVMYDPATRLAYDIHSTIGAKLTPIGRMETSAEGVDRVVLTQDMMIVPLDATQTQSTAPTPEGSLESGALPREPGAVSGAEAGVEPEGGDGEFVFEDAPFSFEFGSGARSKETMVEETLRKAIDLLVPSTPIKAKVLIILEGHSGAGKTTMGKTLIEDILAVRNPNKTYSVATYTSIPPTWGLTYPATTLPGGVQTLPYEKYVRIDPDQILELIPEYERGRVLGKTPDGKTRINQNAVSNPQLREVARDVVDGLYEHCLREELPIIYETLLTDPAYYIESVINKAIRRGYFGHSYTDDVGGMTGALETVASRPMYRTTSATSGSDAPLIAPADNKEREVRERVAEILGNGYLRLDDPGALDTPALAPIKEELEFPRGYSGMDTTTRERYNGMTQGALPYTGQLVFISFFDGDLERTKVMVRERSALNGRYVPDDVIQKSWEESRSRDSTRFYERVFIQRESVRSKSGRREVRLMLPVDAFVRVEREEGVSEGGSEGEGAELVQTVITSGSHRYYFGRGYIRGVRDGSRESLLNPETGEGIVGLVSPELRVSTDGSQELMLPTGVVRERWR